MKNKLIVFSGIQPTGFLTIGNYIGAIKQWIKLQKINKYKNIFMIADLHCSYKYIHNYLKLKENIYNTLALLLACNINYTKNIIFLQSKISEHYKLYWLLNSFVYFNELLKMNKFKQKLYQNKKIPINLFNYPILMAADILLYKSNYVPVGIDQKQHLELVNNIIKKINNTYNIKIYKKIKKLILYKNSKIMSLNNPLIKMSKSNIDFNSYITLLDTKDQIKNKILKAVTDSEKNIYFNKYKKPAISNLLLILSNITNKSILNLELEYKHLNYIQFKLIIIETINNFLFKIQKKYYNFRKNVNMLKKILNIGNIKAKIIAKKNFFSLAKLIKLL